MKGTTNDIKDNTIDASTKKDGNDNDKSKNEPRARTRQPTGTQKRQKHQKTSLFATEITQIRDKETNPRTKKTAKLTEEDIREEEANLIGAMLDLAGMIAPQTAAIWGTKIRIVTWNINGLGTR